MEYFPIVMEVNWVPNLFWNPDIGGFKMTESQMIEYMSILIVHKSDLMIAFGQMTILEARMLLGFLRKLYLLIMVFFLVLIKSLMVLL